MSALFTKIVIARIAVALMIVVPPVLLYQKSQANSERSVRNEQIGKVLLRNDGKLAQERIDRTIATCVSYNEQRIASIATSEALIRIAASSPTTLTDRDKLLLAAFVKKADRQIEHASKAKKCTVEALHLQPLQGIVKQAQVIAQTGSLPEPGDVLLPTSSASTTVAPPSVSPTPTTVRGTPPPPRNTTTTVVTCVRKHGRCPPK